MPETESEFLKRLRATFAIEAQEHIGTLSSGLVQLESAPPEERAGLIETVFRGAHSLKGAARAVNDTRVEQLCQEMEGTLSALKRHEIQLSPKLLDALLKSTDALRQMLETGGPHVETHRPDPAQASPAIAASRSTNVLPPLEPRSSMPEKAQTIRIATDRLEALMLQVEEMVSAKVAIRQHADTVGNLRCSFETWRTQWARINDVMVRFARDANGVTSAERMRMSEFLDRNETFFHTVQDQFAALEKPFRRDQRALNAMVDTLLEEMKAVLMLPFSSLGDLLLRVVRDVAREQGKEADFTITGGAVEVDRRILEELKDPLIHLVRNAVDHGLETPDERIRLHKPPRGNVSLSVMQKDSAKVEVLLSDDGRGINEELLKTVAVESGVLPQAEADQLSADQLAALVFRSGISTASTVSSISGRGLGLAIVQEKVEKLGGTITLKTEIGRGTAFQMSVPLTVSTFRGVIVAVGSQQFVFPTMHVERIVRVRREDIKTAGNRETIFVSGEPVALVQLRDSLGLPDSSHPANETAAVTVLLVASRDQRLAIAVDAVEREQDMLLKNLGRQLLRVRNIAGTTILGNGRVLPVLHVADLLKGAARLNGATKAPVPAKPQTKTKKSILVVDDSITSRTLFKSILESNGYRVETAVDGLEGLAAARGGEFSLVVSDVEMPRMNGFELATKIRSDKNLASLPLILVTALGSREDKERGMDVGANAYIVKSSFDQSNLLEAVRRLI